MNTQMLFISNLQDLGNAFRSERRALGKTQGDIAEAAQLRRETIIRIEAGNNVDAITLLKAISALGKGLMIADKRPDYDAIKEIFNED